MNKMAFKGLIGSAAATLWHGSVRYGHFQRSHFVNILPWYIEALSVRGKPKRKGLRRPMPWTCGRFGINNRDFTVPLVEAQAALRDLVGDDISLHHYLLPDFDPPSVPIEECERIAPRPMSAARFLLYLVELLSRSPYWIPLSELTVLTRHAFRHGLVTIAQRAQLAPRVLVSLGLWGSQAGDQEAKMLVRRLAMPLLYAAERLTTMATGKTELVRATGMALVQYARTVHGIKTKRVDLNQFNCNPRFTPSLDDLVPYWPTQEEARAFTAESIACRRGNRKPDSSIQQIEAATSEPLEDAEVASEAELDESESSGTETSSSSGAEQLSGSDSICWVCTQESTGRLHMLDPGASEILDGAKTTCGRRLRLPVIGTGLAEAIEADRQWSPRCFARLPRIVVDKWRELSHDAPDS